MVGLIYNPTPKKRARMGTPRLTRRAFAAGAGAVAAGGWTSAAFAGQRDSARPEPSPRPVDGMVDGPEALVVLLSLVPAGFIRSAEHDDMLFYYGDLAMQLEALGLEPLPPGSDELPDGFLEATPALALASSAFQSAFAPEFAEAIGFGPLSTHQSLLVGQPPMIHPVNLGG